MEPYSWVRSKTLNIRSSVIRKHVSWDSAEKRASGLKEKVFRIFSISVLRLYNESLFFLVHFLKNNLKNIHP